MGHSVLSSLIRPKQGETTALPHRNPWVLQRLAAVPAGREAAGSGGGEGARSDRRSAPRRTRAPRCHSGWRRPLQEGPLPALPAPSLASADADVGAGSWRDARISAGRLLGVGAPRYLPSGAGAGASRAGCMLQRETPGCRGGRRRQAKAASTALCWLWVPGGSPHPQPPPPNRVREEHHPLPSRRSSLGPGCVEDARALGACVSPQGAGGKVESTCAHTQAASQLASGLLSSEPVLAYPSLSPRSLLD